MSTTPSQPSCLLSASCSLLSYLTAVRPTNRSYGSVYKAVRKSDGGVVAVKVVPLDDDIEDLRQEVDVMKECKSPFIVNYEATFFKDMQEVWVCSSLRCRVEGELIARACHHAN